MKLFLYYTNQNLDFRTYVSKPSLETHQHINLILTIYIQFTFIILGGPVVPSGNLSSPPVSSAASSHHMVPTSAVGYTTTGRQSTHQQQPMSFTRALEITENIDQGGGQPRGFPRQQQQQQQQQPQSDQQKNDDGSRRDSVYDMNSYEISV